MCMTPNQLLAYTFGMSDLMLKRQRNKVDAVLLFWEEDNVEAKRW